jgi:hypothetical protein
VGGTLFFSLQVACAMKCGFSMDQAASIIPEGGSALYITFHPILAAEPVRIPISMNREFNPVFVIANSLVVSDKAVLAKTQYNLRVVETLVAARVLARHLGLDVGPREKITLRQVLDRWIGLSDGVGMSLSVLKDGLTRIVRELDILKPNLKNLKNAAESRYGLSMEEMIVASGLSDCQFKDLYLSWVEGESPTMILHYHKCDWPPLNKLRQHTSSFTNEQNMCTPRHSEY